MAADAGHAPRRLSSTESATFAELRRIDERFRGKIAAALDLPTNHPHIASGLSLREARYAALRAMDGLEQRKEEMRDMRRIHWLTDFVDDVRYAIRSLRRTPGLAALVVMTLALGIGMTAAPFSMIDALV